MKDVHVVGKKMTRNAGKMAKLIGCAFHFETEFMYFRPIFNQKEKVSVCTWPTGVDICATFSHCYSVRSNLWNMGPLQFCLIVFLGIHRNPKQNVFFNSLEGFLRWSHLSTFIHLDKHLDGAWDKFWIKSQNGTFIALQMKDIGPKNFQISCRG